MTRRIASLSIAVAGLLSVGAVFAEPVGLPADFWSSVTTQVQINPLGGLSTDTEQLDLQWVARTGGSGFRLAGPVTMESRDEAGNLLGALTLGNETGGGFWFDPDPVLVFAGSAVNHSNAPLLYSFAFNMPLVPALTGTVDSYAELGVTLTDSSGNGAYFRPLVMGGDVLTSFDIDADGWAISKNVDIGGPVSVVAGAHPGTAQQIFWQTGSLVCETACVTMSALLTFVLSPGDAVGFSGRVEQVSAVPLPAGIWLLGTGLLGLAGLRRRRPAVATA